MKKKRLYVASVSGRIYQSSVLEDGTLSDNKVDMTEDVLSATHHRFLNTGSFGHTIEPNGYIDTTSYLFHTTDESVANKIIQILRESE